MCKRFAFIAILFILVPLNVFSQVTYDAKNKLITVKSEGRPLGDILSEISTKVSVNFYISPAANKKVFVDIENQPLDTAIKMMIKPLNSAIIFEGDSIVEVKIFENSVAESSLRIIPSVAYPKHALPSIERTLDEKNLTVEEFEEMERVRRRTGIAPPGTVVAAEGLEKGWEKRKRKGIDNGGNKESHQE